MSKTFPPWAVDETDAGNNSAGNIHAPVDLPPPVKEVVCNANLPALFADVLNCARDVFGEEAWMSFELRRLVKQRANKFTKLLSCLALRDTKQKVRKTLKSFDAKFCSLLLGWPLTVSGRASLPVIEELASMIDAWKDCEEPVKAYLKRKSSAPVSNSEFAAEHYRIICEFGPKRRALQVLARETLRAIGPDSPFEYAARGRGRDKAMNTIINSIQEKGGPRWFLTADIKDCFSSFDREGVIKFFPLPDRVIECCLLIPDDAIIKITGKQHAKTSELAVRKGIPQGSLASSYMANKLLEPILVQLTEVEICLSHADDILIGVKSQDAAQASKQALADLLEQHSAGPLFMKTCCINPLGLPINFLGYKVKRRGKIFGGGARVVPSQTAFKRLTLKIVGRIKNVPKPERMAIAEETAKNWRASQRSWEKSVSGEDLLWLTCHQIVEYVNMLEAGKVISHGDPDIAAALISHSD